MCVHQVIDACDFRHLLRGLGCSPEGKRGPIILGSVLYVRIIHRSVTNSLLFTFQPASQAGSLPPTCLTITYIQAMRSWLGPCLSGRNPGKNGDAMIVDLDSNLRKCVDSCRPWVNCLSTQLVSFYLRGASHRIHWPMQFAGNGLGVTSPIIHFGWLVWSALCLHRGRDVLNSPGARHTLPGLSISVLLAIPSLCFSTPHFKGLVLTFLSWPLFGPFTQLPWGKSCCGSAIPPPSHTPPAFLCVYSQATLLGIP